MITDRPFTFDRVVRLLLGAGLFILTLWLINLLKDVLLPFVVACLIAYILEPMVQYNRSILHLKGRTLASIVTLFEITTLLTILCYFFIPIIIRAANDIASLMKDYASSDVSIPFLPADLHKLLKSNINFEEIARRLTQQDLQNIMDNSLSFISGGVGVIMSIVEWLLVFLYIIFIMIDYDNLMRGFRMLVPPKYRRQTFKIGYDIKRSMNHYFRGQALIACIVAVCYSIGFSIVGIPMAIILGILAGICFMVPYMVYITLIPVTLICLVCSVDMNIDFWHLWWKCIAVYAFTQVLSDIILTPKIMGKAMGLNPAIILLSLSIWGTLLGIIGMIIALPLTTLIISYYNEYLIKRSQRAIQKTSSQN
ncbi:MAG: AI-2E family transporter [Muribaculaceae bacterium]|nr:AI-2E family transporter [Muribaculaceae bacterium]